MMNDIWMCLTLFIQIKTYKILLYNSITHDKIVKFIVKKTKVTKNANYDSDVFMSPTRPLYRTIIGNFRFLQHHLNPNSSVCIPVPWVLLPFL